MGIAETAVYLSGCALNGKIPDESHLEGVNFDGLYRFAEAHMITALIGYALESAGINYRPFTQTKAKAEAKAIILDTDRRTISGLLENSGIWHIIQKGPVISSCYPSIGMRQSGDVDMLFDTSRISDTREIIIRLGFELKNPDDPHHDVYLRKPVSSVEMHKNLFEPWKHSVLGRYYENVKERLILDDGKKYTYHFTDEDAYIYMAAHAFKHYSEGGTGLRTVFDVNMYLKKFSGLMDWEYIHREAGKLGISDFEQVMRSLSSKIFEGGRLSEKESDMMKYITQSGVYGNTDNLMKHELFSHYGGSRAKYFFRQIFPPFSRLKHDAPHVWRHKYLYPVYVIKRIMSVIFRKQDKVKAFLKVFAGRVK